MRRPRAKPPLSRQRPATGEEGEALSLVELERFDRAKLRQWLDAGARLDALGAALYFDLEPARQRRGQELLDALRAGAQTRIEFTEWVRIVDFQYSLRPLSTAGSVSAGSIGGRFNIGGGLSPSVFTPFPALYVADEFRTAYRERFGASPDETRDGLTFAELALRKTGSFAQVRVRGCIDTVIDVGTLDSLRPMADVIRGFRVPDSWRRLARKLGMRPPSLIRSPATLQRQLLHKNWRIAPVQHSVPSNSQVFGRMAVAAGVQAIRYPSARDTGRQCLAIFPQCFAGSDSYIEVMDPAPDGCDLIRLDGESRRWI